ncbi:1-phosphofructokinase [Bacillus sp. FJAT-47783]|uniref:1-phosphofructokinase n=1 Tax=Bacillus sp. FJAT-47783 TaxID=2922712 RepID=UPI001FABC63A|nr:1-phosphofructokinase [Bacillus sp. FJAT-47783]
MIYTVTLNPSVDYIVEVPTFQLGQLNRIQQDAKYPGGKGINVSRVLNRFEVKTSAFGFVGGWTGSFVEASLRNEGIKTNFVHIKEDTRINIKLKTGEETEINGQGPIINEEEVTDFFEALSSLNANDWLVIAGSIPASLPNDFYEKITSYCQERNIQVVIDVSGDYIHSLLQYKPFLLKPNHHELGEWFNVDIDRKEDAVTYGKKLVKMGAQNVIVSMAGEGALFLNDHVTYYASPPNGKVVNSVGAGDSVVAGFLSEYTKTKDVKRAFQYSIASGSATAFSLELCTKAEVEKLLPEVKIEDWK